jgi:hypothetical protein
LWYIYDDFADQFRSGEYREVLAVGDKDAEIGLLREIRDLLIPIAAHYRPAFEEQMRTDRNERAQRLLRIVRGRQARSSCLMMDGSNDQAAIRQSVGIGSGNLSTLISRLQEQGMLVEAADRRRPELIFTPEELQDIFGGRS